jgi:hypothetical protein
LQSLLADSLVGHKRPSCCHPNRDLLESKGDGSLASTKSKTDARTLELLLTFSAGMHRSWKRSDILRSYSLVFDFQNLYQEIDDRLLRSHSPFTVAQINQLASKIGQFRPNELLVATAHCGHFIAFMNACAQHGIPLTMCYKAASKSYLNAAARNRLRLVDLSSQKSVHSLFRSLDSERARGYYVAIMIDGPFSSRRRFRFLGYEVSASSLAELYARKSGSALLPLISRASDTLELSFSELGIIEKLGNNLTQQMLDWLQTAIFQNPSQYQWLSNSILMSNEIARDTALSFLPEALAWRERIISSCT